MTKDRESGYDIRSILQEMREEYWRSLEGIEKEREEQLECVTFLLGGETYAFETVHAAEVLRVPRLVKVPKVQKPIVGVFNLRGEITAALDIRSLLGLPQPPLTAAARIIVVKGATFATGLLTEEVKEVASLPLSTLEPVATSIAGAQREYIRGQLTVGNGLVMLLDIRKLMAAAEIVVESR